MGDPNALDLRIVGMTAIEHAQATFTAFLAAELLRAPRAASAADIGQLNGKTARAGESASTRNGSVENAIEEMNRLVTAVAETRDRAAFHDVFTYFAPRVKAVLMRQGTDPGLAEEVVQETMARVWRKAALFDPAKASASTWIFRIARNIRIDHVRRASRPEPDIDDPALVADPDPQADEMLSRSQDALRLREVFAQLPKEQQDVLTLAFFEEKAHAEIAVELGVPLGTVKSRIRLAFKRIRSELGA